MIDGDAASKSKADEARANLSLNDDVLALALPIELKPFHFS